MVVHTAIRCEEGSACSMPHGFATCTVCVNVCRSTVGSHTAIYYRRGAWVGVCIFYCQDGVRAHMCGKAHTPFGKRKDSLLVARKAILMRSALSLRLERGL